MPATLEATEARGTRAGLAPDAAPVAAVPRNPVLRSLLKEVADAQAAGAAGAGYDAVKALRSRKALQPDSEVGLDQAGAD